MENEYEMHLGQKWSRRLPTHAYHPNASLLMNQRTGYIGWPAGHRAER